MNAQNLKQRVKDDSGATAEKTRSRRNKRTPMARRGLRSLSTAVAFPLSLTLFTIWISSAANHRYGALTKPFWFPPLWVLHATGLASSFLMGLSAWLVWTEGGFHKNPTALSLYLAQLGLGLGWEMVVFRFGANWAGLGVCLATFGSQVGCSKVFREINPIAGDLVLPCLAWGAFLAVVNLKLVFL